MSTPTSSPAKRVSARTPKLSAKMIALEEEVNLKRRKTGEPLKPSDLPLTSTPTASASSTANHQNSTCLTEANATPDVDEEEMDEGVAAVQTAIAPPRQKSKGATWNSGPSSSSPRNRKRKSHTTSSSTSGSSSAQANSGGGGGTPRKSRSSTSNSTELASLGRTSAKLSIAMSAGTDSSGEGSGQSSQHQPLQHQLPPATGRTPPITISLKTNSIKQVDLGTASASSGSGGMYEESELDVTQFTTDGGGGGCSSSQQLLVVDDTSESTVSMMSLGVTSGSPGAPFAPVGRTTTPASSGAGGGKDSKKKKSSANGKKLQENNASEDEAEEKWLMAIEAGKLEEDVELRSMKDPALMTARQRAVVQAKQARVEYLQHIQALQEAWRDQAATEQLSTEVLEKRAQKAAKRRRLAEEKRDKEKKDTIKRLLKKADSRQKAKKLQRSRAQLVAKVSYRYTYEGMTVSFPVETPPASLGIDLTPKRAQYPTPVLCSNFGCANIKKYQCSSNGLPVCSLPCYRQVSLLPPLAQLLESAAGSTGVPEDDGEGDDVEDDNNNNDENEVEDDARVLSDVAATDSSNVDASTIEATIPAL